jgi:NodT family efflux transporter outer membrane factor (OMF) lipoprotein
MTYFVRYILIGLCSVALAGCTVGPNFQSPAASTQMPADWIGPTSQPTTQQSVASSEPTDIAVWWNAFDDAQLTSLIDRAIASNLDLKLATSRIREARAARGVVTAGLFPNVDTNASYQRSRPTGGRAGASFDRSTDLFRAGLDASWEIDIFGGVRRSVEAAEADIQSAVEDRRDVLVTLASEVALDYLDLRSFQRQIEIARRNLETQEKSLDLTQRRQRGGFVSNLDVANAQAQVASTRAGIPLLEASARQAIYAIAVLLGQQPATMLDELSSVAPIPGTPPTVPIGLPSELLRRRPDIRRAEAELHAATARIGVATADLFPRFSLTGAFGLSGAQASDLVNFGNRFWSFGPAVSWPLFDAGRIGSNIEVQNARQEQALLAYRRAVLVALQDVESSLIAFEKEQQHRASLVDAVEANRRAVDIATRLYTEGRTDFLNVLNAERGLLASEDSLAQSDRLVAQDLVSVYKSLGGGWEGEQQIAEATTQPASPSARSPG